MKEELCEGCMEPANMLFSGLCHDCFEQLKAEVGGITLPEEYDLSVVELPAIAQVSRKRKTVELFEAPIQEWVKQVKVTAVINTDRTAGNREDETVVGHVHAAPRGEVPVHTKRGDVCVVY